jgi:hypothetical protein
VALVNDTLETPIEEVVKKQRKQPVWLPCTRNLLSIFSRAQSRLNTVSLTALN